MRIKFVREVINHYTGNTLRKPGEIADIRDGYAAALISQGYAISLDKPASFDWTVVPTVSEELSERLNGNGVTSPTALLAFPDLTLITGIGPARARMLKEFVANA